MPPRKPRETAKQRDERILAEVGPWCVYESWLHLRRRIRPFDATKYDRVTDAAARILNRVVKEHKDGK